jgi:hypothetical protein
VGLLRRALVLAALAAAGLAPTASAAPIAVHATIDPPVVQVGEAMTLRVAVVADRRQVRAGSIHVADDVAPLTALTPVHVTTTVVGDDMVAAAERTAICSTAACVSSRGDATPRLPPIRVSATGSDGRPLRVEANWPVLRVRGRVTASDLAGGRRSFRADTAPPPVSYRLPASTLAWLLDGAAVVLGLGAVTLAVAQILRLRRRRGTPPVDELERAVGLAREAAGRPASDRRRALGLLARLLAARDRRLAEEANALAWSASPPERESVVALVGDVEREVTP